MPIWKKIQIRVKKESRCSGLASTFFLSGSEPVQNSSTSGVEAKPEGCQIVAQSF